MDERRIGRAFRALRLRSDRRQRDVASAVGVSRQMISRIEMGAIRRISLGTVDRVASELGADLDVRVRWHGEGLDRLLDAAHASLVERAVSMLTGAGWEAAVEVSFAIRGERGSVDVVGLRRDREAILIAEVKSVVPDVGGMLSTLDRKARLGREIAAQLGWPCQTVSRLLIVGDSTTTRRRVTQFAAMFTAALPSRGWVVRRWLKEPEGSLAGIVFLPYARPGGVRHGVTGRQRVRLPKVLPKSG